MKTRLPFRFGLMSLALFGCLHSIKATPTIAFTSPTNSQQIVTLSGITGTVQSTGTIQQVRFSIYNQSGQWWNGTIFQSATTNLPTTLAGTNWTPALLMTDGVMVKATAAEDD